MLRPRARLARGLKTPQGAQAFLHLLAGNLDSADLAGMAYGLMLLLTSRS